MSTTEELIEATVNADGTATVRVQGGTHEFTAVNETAARAQTVKLVSKRAIQRGTAVRAAMHDEQGFWPVKVHPDGNDNPDTIPVAHASAQPVDAIDRYCFRQRTDTSQIRSGGS